EERAIVTVIKAIFTLGKVIPPYIIILSKEINTRYIRNRLSDKTVLNSSSSGYIDD
ncbi:hypothetical protein QBC39DRAFT_262776, partial [Podospora conica]